MLGSKDENFVAASIPINKLTSNQISRPCYGVWLAVMLDESMMRLRSEPFSVTHLRWRAGPLLCRWLATALKGFTLGDYSDPSVRAALDVAAMGHCYDLSPGAFGADCRAVNAIGFMLERMMRSTDDSPQAEDVAEACELAAELAIYQRADYLESLANTFQELIGDFFPSAAICQRLVGRVCTPELQAILLLAGRLRDGR